MKAVVLHEYGGPDKLKLEEVSDPVASAGEMLIRVSAASVNPIDNKLRSGVMKDMMPLQFPAILGFDFSGVVRVVGEGVHGFAPGDQVFGRSRSTFAELVVAKPEDVNLLPQGLDLVSAAALPVVTLTGDQAVRRGAALTAGQTILITGALGSAGRAAVFSAKEAELTVIAGVRKAQHAEAEKLGVHSILHLDDATAIAEQSPVDAVADFVGHTVGEQLLKRVKDGGAFITAVGPPANAKDYPGVRVQMMQVSADGNRLQHLAQAVVSGTLTIPIDRTIPLDQAAAGVAAVEKGGIGKVLLLA